MNVIIKLEKRNIIIKLEKINILINVDDDIWRFPHLSPKKDIFIL